MSDTKKILDLYFVTNKLKNVLRQGWLYWKVENARIESIAEHIYGTLMLAISICANTNQDVDLYKVALMLALHEIEEIEIGDVTMFDSEKLATKKEDGKRAVEKIFENCANKQEFLNIISEFEQCKTKEAKFAKACDKFEADLQAYLYRNNFAYDKVDKDIYANKQIQEYTANGITQVHQMFINSDMKWYDGIFIELAKELENLN
ncbi:MAG: HD domain-containing protein [Clostridia bacterium]|nr:HD domain-containing protein [Clostridia bacterium]